MTNMEGYTIKQLINENEKLNNENINCYIAGFFDGEGSIEIGKSYVLKVRFTITHYSILSKIQKLYGGQIYKIDMKKNIQAAKNRGKEYKSTPKQVWQWTLYSYDTLKFMKSILPYLDEKKMQILLGIEYQEGKKSYRGWEGTPQLEIDRCECLEMNYKN